MDYNTIVTPLHTKRTNEEELTSFELATLLVMSGLSWNDLSKEEKKLIYDQNELSELVNFYETKPEKSSNTAFSSDQMSDILIDGMMKMCELDLEKEIGEYEWATYSPDKKADFIYLHFAKNYGNNPEYLREKLKFNFKQK